MTFRFEPGETPRTANAGDLLSTYVLYPGLQHMQNHRVTCLALKHSFECTNPELKRSFIRGSVISDESLTASVATRTSQRCRMQ